MADPRRIKREQLAKFLPDHETIKTFEQLFEYVTETLPTILLEIQYIEIAGNNREQFSATNRLNDIEVMQPRPANQNKLENKIRDIELMQPRPANIKALEDRISELEIQVARRENNDAFLRRLEDLEKIVGV